MGTRNTLLDNMRRIEVPYKFAGHLEVSVLFEQSLNLRVNQKFIEILLKILPQTKWKTLKSESSSYFDKLG